MSESTPKEDEVAPPLYRCLTKATRAEGDDIRRSFSWVASRRAMLEVRGDSMVCGDWTIPYDEIDEAVLFSTKQMFIIPVYVLRAKSKGTVYQFGLNPNRYWKGDLPFPAHREKMRLGYSTYSIVVRVILVAIVIYLLWNRFGGGES